MGKAFIYLTVGTAVSFLLNHYLLATQGAGIDLYYGFAFGLAWATAFYLDNDDFQLPLKLAASLGVMTLMVIAGVLFFNVEIALPSVLKFSIVFVAYYLIASFRRTKSLRK